MSSYTPTLEALLNSCALDEESTLTTAQRSDPRILVVAQTNTPGKSALPNTTVKEANSVRDIFLYITTILDNERATVSKVIDGMKTNSWVHLAYHGIHDLENPMRSAFALHDGPLDIATFIESDLAKGELAIVSACQNASADYKLSQEAMHLAATLLNLGFKSVVGTLWSISDRTTPNVMRKFYKFLWEQLRRGGIQPAYALHEAITDLRRVEPDNLVGWVPYAHFGPYAGNDT